MGYYLGLGLKCKTTIGRSYGPETNMSKMAEKCDTKSLCKGILLPNCDAHHDSKTMCQEYEDDNSTDQAFCIYIKSKLMC